MTTVPPGMAAPERTAIEVIETVEPLSASSLDPARHVYVRPIASDASRLLIRELRRYCAGMLNGRSFLISGHRGAGKTTLVTGAVLELLRTPVDESGSARPLLVTLHGPGLFPAEKPAAEKPAGSAPDPAAPAGSKAEAKPQSKSVAAAPAGTAGAPTATGQSSAEGAGEKTPPRSESTTSTPTMDAAGGPLLQMILGLHRAAAREVASAFRDAVKARSARPRHEDLELAAQLELELFEPLTADPARLRQLWAQGGFLPGGVLPLPVRVATMPPLPLTGVPSDQGWRELLAMAGLWQAYRRISGEFSEKQQTRADAIRKAEAGVSTETKDGKELTSALMTLLTGGLVGAGLHAANMPPAAATALGILSALGAALTLKVSASRALARTESWESTFIPNLRPETLDRVLPVLLERLRDAGLYPVFLVDELDKVEDLSERILPLVHHLKKLVAERAFFCFLTDRDYFEEMRTRVGSYTLEYTYFTDRLFVTFAPEDLHTYLKERLRRPPKPAAEATTPESRRAVEAHIDFPFVRYVILHRAQMHALDIQREIAALEKRGGIIESPGQVRNLVYLLDVVMQLAVERVLDDDDLAAALDRDATYRRLVHDALYYLARRWDVENDVDLDDMTGAAAFSTYLRERTGSKKDISFPKETAFLLAKVRRLAKLLSDSQQFVGVIRTWNDKLEKRSGQTREEDGLGSEILEVVGRLQDESMPLEAMAAPSRYRWRFARSGIAIPAAAPKQMTPAAARAQALVPAPAEWRPDCEFITAVDQALGRLGQ